MTPERQARLAEELLAGALDLLADLAEMQTPMRELAVSAQLACDDAWRFAGRLHGLIQARRGGAPKAATSRAVFEEPPSGVLVEKGGARRPRHGRK